MDGWINIILQAGPMRNIEIYFNQKYKFKTPMMELLKDKIGNPFNFYKNKHKLLRIRYIFSI